MFKKTNLIIFLIPLFIACSSEPQTKIPGEPITISLRKSNMPPSVKLSEMTGSIRLVALETKPGCYFGRVMQIDQIKDKIFIMDYDRKQGILVFDKYGKHLYNIGNPGKGPGEYTTLVGFSFSNELFQIHEDDVLFSRAYSALCTTYQSELVSVINPAYAIDKVDQILNNDDFDYPDGFKNKIKQMDIEDNPLLIFFTFK